MTEESQQPEAAPPPSFRKEYTSESKDLGVAYVENFHRRKIITITKEDIINALNNAAENGSEDPAKSNLVFVRELLSKELIFLTSKDDRKKIFFKAALKDKQKQEE